MDYFDDAYFGDYFDTDQTPAGRSPRRVRRLMTVARQTPDPDADEAYLLAGVL